MSATLEQVTSIAAKLDPVEKLKLVKYLAESLEKSNFRESKPRDLRGIWKHKFPENFDVEKEIKLIRGQWEKKFDDR